jgi:hypothetical protein
MSSMLQLYSLTRHYGIGSTDVDRYSIHTFSLFGQLTRLCLMCSFSVGGGMMDADDEICTLKMAP